MKDLRTSPKTRMPPMDGTKNEDDDDDDDDEAARIARIQKLREEEEELKKRNKMKRGYPAIYDAA